MHVTAKTARICKLVKVMQKCAAQNHGFLVGLNKKH